MKFVVIFGPPAVGKMTVGQALEQRTGFKLFHNHQTIDLVIHYFDYGTPPFTRIVSSLRKQIIEEAAANDLPGLIFTYVWAIDDPEDKQFIDELSALVEKHSGETYYVELEADFDERIQRNRSENRLRHKAKTKADLERSERNLRAWDQQYQMNSNGDFFYSKNYLKINNTNLSPDEVARQIQEYFQFE